MFFVDGTCEFYVHEYAASFSLRGVSHDVFDCQVHDVNWCIVHSVFVFVWVIAEYEP